MLFVNQIAEITHSQITKYGGSANKNIGDAFLLVWKFKKEDEFKTKTPIAEIKLCIENRQVSDLALFSFLKVIAKISKFREMLEYRQDPGLNERMPNYKVKMGFGLHQGWAIEGAIGSFFKIDASYLSPNVNMAARLEAATKQYGVPLLLTGDMFECFTPEVKTYCREIDRVTVKGSIQPVRLYTVDINFEDMEEIPNRFEGMALKEKKRILDRESRELFLRLQRQKKTTYQMISQDRDFAELRRDFNPQFARDFEVAYNDYIKGKWPRAIEQIKHCLKMNPLDGPCLTLLDILQNTNNGQTPPNWEGFRNLTEK